MAYQIKGSKFNARTIADGARPTKKTIQNGVPTNGDPESININNMIASLLRNQLISNDRPTTNDLIAPAILCLEGLGITSEEILQSEPERTLTPKHKETQSIAGKRSGIQKKSTTEYTFTEASDPFYEMDQSPAVYVQKTRSKDIVNQDQRALRSLIASIGEINRIPNHLRLKQLVEK
tara:strand:- start:579 stop:1112 length:534 start_codon:yes stop_codon:yes gene_type:complete